MPKALKPVKKVVKKPIKVVVKKEALKKVEAKTVVKNQVKQLAKETTLKQSVYDAKGNLADTITLPKEIFDAKVNNPLMAQAVRVYLANQRRGTVKTKTRGEVKISTRKIYRQKGTGRARHGAASAPIFVGGGVAFGPRPRDYSLSLNQKMRRLALFSALTVKLKNGDIKIVKGLEKLEPKTKLMVQAFNGLASGVKNPKILFITPYFASLNANAVNGKKALEGKLNTGEEFKNVVKSARNIEGINILASNLLNTYEVLKSNNIIFMKESIDTLKETFLKEN
jgi:large subunit ribosomal protein L4